MDLDLACVSSFLVLIDEQHFGRAALQLNMTSSALTKRIQRLEHQLGSQLVERGPSGVIAFTPAGLRFAHHARPLVLQARLAMEAARTEAPSRVIRLGVPGALGEYPQRHELQTVSRGLKMALPDAHLRCLGIPFSQLTESLISQQTDVIWTAARVEHAGLESVPMVAVLRMGVVSTQHELAQATNIPVSELVDQPMIYNPELPEEWMSLWYFGDVRPKTQAHLIRIPAEKSGDVLTHVLRGTGVTAVPAPLASRLGPQLHAIPITDAPPIIFHAVRRLGDRRDLVLALIQILAWVATTSVRNGSPDAPAMSTENGIQNRR